MYVSNVWIIMIKLIKSQNTGLYYAKFVIGKQWTLKSVMTYLLKYIVIFSVVSFISR